MAGARRAAWTSWRRSNRQSKRGRRPAVAQMGWELRNGRRYYYQKRRIGRRVVSEYVGTGPSAELAEYIDADKRHMRLLEAAERADERQAIDVMRAEDQAFSRQCDVLRDAAAALLRRKGLHRHRGQWRRRRAKTRATPVDTDKSPAPSGHDPESERRRWDELVAVWDAATAPDATPDAIERFQEALRDKDGTMMRATDLGRYAIRFLTYNPIISHDRNPDSLHDCLTTCGIGVERLKQSLGYEESPPAERLLIDLVAFCHVQTHIVELTYAAVTAGSATPKTLEHYERRLTAAQDRYRRAIESLQRVRKLTGRLSVQINVAAAVGQQLVTNTSDQR